MVLIVEFERAGLAVGVSMHRGLDFNRRSIRSLRVVPTAPI